MAVLTTPDTFVDMKNTPRRIRVPDVIILAMH
jgi:hypothetical protein